MKFFLDSADLAEIEEAASWGVVGGVTTNPTLYARTGGKLAEFEPHIQKICALVDGPVSAEAVGESREEIIEEGRRLNKLADNVVVKIPTTTEGLAATKMLAAEGVDTNLTLCFSVPQAIMAARAGARYISPFVGRFDDISEDGLQKLEEIVTALDNYDFGHEVEVIGASIRSANHVTQSALMGTDIATVPFGVLKGLVRHPLTDRGLKSFASDWEQVVSA